MTEKTIKPTTLVALLDRISRKGAKINEVSYSLTRKSAYESKVCSALVDEFEELKKELEDLGAWDAVCSALDWHPSCTGWDHTA